MNLPTSSLPQIEANRANARHSTGPSTEEGKAASSQNARVHGLCSRQLHIADAEESAIFASLRDALSLELAPFGELELLHFDALLHAQWNLRRCRMNEANLLASVPDPFLDPATRAALKTLAIYTARHERAFRSAMKELKALQNERAARTNFVMAEDDESELLSPLVETSRVRRTLLAEARANITHNKTAASPVSTSIYRQTIDGGPVAGGV